MKKIKKYIIISIKEYNSFENVINLISLIDEKVIGKEYIYNTNYLIEWKRTNNSQYDYSCKIFLNELNKEIDDLIKKYIHDKFYLVQNYIKFNYDKFGTNWTIDFDIVDK